MKMIIRSSLIVIMFLMAASVARACFCLLPDVKTGFERAGMAFVGEVLEIIPPRQH